MRRSWKWEWTWLTCVVCLGCSATVRAQTAEPVTEAQPTTSSPPSAASAPVRRWRSLQDPEQTGPRATKVEADVNTEPVDLAGALGWEIVGGMIPLITGVGLVAASFDPGHGGHVPSFRINPPIFSIGMLLTAFGPPAGVAIAGNATGGTGSIGYAYLGALAGLPLSVPGMLIGSILGYRLSADDEDAKPATCVWQPFLTRDQIAFRVSGRI